MIRDGVLAGRLTIDDHGLVAHCNRDLARIIRSTRSNLLGRHILEITAHADRDRCIEIFHQIRNDGRPVTTVRRVIRADGSHAWVKIDVTVPEWPNTDTIAMRVEECAAPEDWIEPAILLKLAQGMVDARRARTAAFGDTLFGDYAWDLLLVIYIAEAEGRVLTTAQLHAALGMGPMLIGRWMRALHAEALIGYESADTKPSETAPIRLSTTAHRKFEDFLSGLFRGTRRLDSVKLPVKQADEKSD